MRKNAIDVLLQVKTELHVNPRNENHLRTKERHAARQTGALAHGL